MKLYETITIKKSFKGTLFMAFIARNENNYQVSLNGWDERFCETLKEAKEQANKMIASDIDNLKFS